MSATCRLTCPRRVRCRLSAGDTSHVADIVTGDNMHAGLSHVSAGPKDSLFINSYLCLINKGKTILLILTLPLSMIINISSLIPLLQVVVISSFSSRPRNRFNFNWMKATDTSTSLPPQFKSTSTAATLPTNIPPSTTLVRNYRGVVNSLISSSVNPIFCPRHSKSRTKKIIVQAWKASVFSFFI